MYQLDSRRRRQSQVYFGEPQDLASWRIDTLGRTLVDAVGEGQSRFVPNMTSRGRGLADVKPSWRLALGARAIASSAWRWCCCASSLAAARALSAARWKARARRRPSRGRSYLRRLRVHLALDVGAPPPQRRLAVREVPSRVFDVAFNTGVERRPPSRKRRRRLVPQFPLASL